MRNALLSISVISLLLISLFVIFNCGGDSGTSVTTPSAEIGPEGGTVTDKGGASVYIPPGALNAVTTISVETVASDDDLPSDLDFFFMECSGGGIFEPHGLVFNDSVTITLPLVTSLPPGDTLTLFTWSEADTAWDCSQFPAIVDPGGLSVSAKVTHFSYFVVDISFGNADMFDLLNSETSPENAFSNFCSDFQNEFYGVGTRSLPPQVGCCFEAKYIEFYMEYCDGEAVSTFNHTAGIPTSCPRHERITATKAGAAAGAYTTLSVVIHLDYCVPTLHISNYDNFLDLDKGETGTMISGTFNCSDKFPNTGGTIEFSVEGPGSVAPNRIMTNDTWQVHFESTEEGTAVVTATLASCMNPSGRVTDNVMIHCAKKGDWAAVIEIDFTHSGEGVDWTFQDHVGILADLTIDDEADSAITGTTISGSQEMDVAPESCDLTAVLAPEFAGGYLKGTKIGEVIQFRYAPDPGSFFVMFGLHCEREPDPPFDIMITAYTNMLATIIGDIIFTTPLVEAFPVTVSGSQSFGSDPPIEYTYTLTMARR
ncbi:MAG: hypothetical protein JW814_01780 [Candidatus Krumholzibacteriota bacterium]|nr:hypothetical protein [Candidatus Krumholzibacteriota bacterium]